MENKLKNLSDLHELILLCRTEQAKTQAKEALACYNAGAYKASIVMIWTITVYDLIDKIRELDISGEQAAKNVFDEFTRHQDSIRSGSYDGTFERTILNKVKPLELLNTSQLIDLERLQKDRNRCAHPSFFDMDSPFEMSAEQAKLHIKNAILHVLSQQPMQGKSALDKLFRRIDDRFFPHEEEKTIQAAVDDILSRAKDSLHRSFIYRLITEKLLNAQTEDEFLKFERILSAVKAFKFELYNRLIIDNMNNAFSKELKPENLSWLILWCLKNQSECWSDIEKTNKDKIKKYLSDTDMDHMVNILKYSSTIDELKSISELRLQDITTDNLTSLKSYLPSVAIPRLIELLKGAVSYAEATMVSDVIVKFIGELTDNDAIEIINAGLMNSQVHGAYGYMETHYKDPKGDTLLELIVKKNKLETEKIQKCLDAIEDPSQKKYFKVFFENQGVKFDGSST